MIVERAFMNGSDHPPIVLIHGAWHGGWCWDRVATRLDAAGRHVVTPTLSGLADRAQLLTRQTGLATHIADVAALLAEQDLREAVLVGHSYGGLVITGAAAAMPDRIGRLVYLDAFVPRAGDSAMSLLPPDRAAHYANGAAEAGDGWRIPPLPASGLGIDDPADAAWVTARLTDQPLLTFTQPLPADAPPPGVMPRHYIRCTAGSPSFAPVAASLRTDPDWTYHEVAAGHDAMVTAPAALAPLLLAG